MNHKTCYIIMQKNGGKEEILCVIKGKLEDAKNVVSNIEAGHLRDSGNNSTLGLFIRETPFIEAGEKLNRILSADT